MNNTVKKILALSAGCAVITSSVFWGVKASAENTDTSETDIVSEFKDTLSDKVTVKEEKEYSTYKDETVYVISAPDGGAEKVIVSDWLKDNTKGTDEYTTVESEKNVPVSLKITYVFDGNEVAASEIAGKSGHLVIRYDYTNNEAVTKKINGKDEKIYVPFVAATGLLLDNEHFANVSVDGGTLINDGTKQVVVGIALPGLKESLGIDSDAAMSGSGVNGFDIPTGFTLEADVTDYSPAIAYSFVTNLDYSKLCGEEISLEGIDLDSLISGAVSVITDALTQLSDGSSQLYDGLVSATDGCGQLADGAVTAKDGAKALKDGAVSLKDGAKQLADGAKDAKDGAAALSTGAKSAADGAKQLNDGVSQLSSGLKTLTDNNAQLTGGAKQVFDTLLSTAYTSLIGNGLTVPELTIDNYSTVIEGAIATLEATDADAMARAEVTSQVNASRSVVEAQVTEAVKAQVMEKVLATVGMNGETYAAAKAAGMVDDATVAQLEGAVAMQMKSDDVKAIIKQNTDEQIAQLIEKYMASSDVKKKIKEGKAQVKSGVKSLKELKTSLDSYNTFYQGIISYTNGVASAYDGSKQLGTGAKSLKEGLGTLSTGASSLSTGLNTLSDGTSTLADGAKTIADNLGNLETGLDTLATGISDLKDGLVQLRDGAKTLSDGLTTFKTELTDKLDSFDTSDIEGYVDRINAILEASSDYRSFTGLDADQDGKVKYIYKIR